MCIRDRRDTDKAAVVDDALELVATLQETCHRILVLHLLRNDEIPSECRETVSYTHLDVYKRQVMPSTRANITITLFIRLKIKW